MNLPHEGAELARDAAPAPSAVRPPVIWALLAGVIHLLLWVAAAFLIAHTRRASLGELVSAGGTPLLMMGAATLLCFIGLLALARPLLASESMGAGLWLALVPPLAAAGALHLLVQRALAKQGALSSSAEGAARATAAIGRAMDVYALGVAGSALGLSFLACLVALRVSSRPLGLRVGSTTLLVGVIGAAGAVATLLKLAVPLAPLLAVPLALGVLIVAISAAALDGRFDTRNVRAAPHAALDTVSAVLLALGAVALGALACGVVDIGQKLSAIGDVPLAAALSSAQRGWTEGVVLLRHAALAALPIVGASAVALAANAVRVGQGARIWGAQSAIVAVATLAIVAGLRFELTRAARAAAQNWSFDGYPNTTLPALAARGHKPAAPAAVERALVLGSSRIRQRSTDLGPVSQLDSDAGCSAVATRVTLDASGPLAIAPNDSLPFQRVGCLLRALLALPSGGEGRCNVVLLGTPSRIASAATLPPFDDVNPFPVGLPARVAEWPCQEQPPTPLAVEPTARASQVVAAAAAVVARGGEVFLASTRQDGAPAPTAEAPAGGAQVEKAVAAPTTRETRIEFEPVTVKGRMFPSEVQGRLELLRKDFVRCTDRAPADALDHAVTLEFVIGEGGGVIYVAPDTKSGLPEAIRSCIQMVLYHIGFPSPKQGTARVFAPVRLQRAR